MKKLALTLIALCALAGSMLAGHESTGGKEMMSSKEMSAPAPCPEWYSDSELNVSIWGAYAFPFNDDVDIDEIDDGTVRHGRLDQSSPIGDHAWGGGLSAKYFFRRYFGVGIEGYGLAAQNDFNEDALERAFEGGDSIDFRDNEYGTGAVKATFTLRYPIPCSRLAPYVFGGVGAMFNVADRSDIIHIEDHTGRPHHFTTRDDDTRLTGQVGGGLEVRLTRHIGITSDFSYNFVEDSDGFGMVRSGLNFAF